MATDKVPVTVLTGFLGSGKTTLLNHILTATHGKKIAVIENEFGDVGIDDGLLAKNTKMQADEEIIEMMNGCICCTVRQDLIVVLAKLAKRVQSGKLKLDGVIIETTGMADPAPVAQTFFVDDTAKSAFRLDGIVTLVDAKHIEQHLDEEKPEGAENEAVEQVACCMHTYITYTHTRMPACMHTCTHACMHARVHMQVAFADRILINKTDLVSEEDLVRIEARIKSMNSHAPLQRCTKAEVAVDWVLDIGAFDLKRTLQMDPRASTWLSHPIPHATTTSAHRLSPPAPSHHLLCSPPRYFCSPPLSLVACCTHCPCARNATSPARRPVPPEFLNTDGSHEHDTTVSSVSITKDELVDFSLFEDYIGVRHYQDRPVELRGDLLTLLLTYSPCHHPLSPQQPSTTLTTTTTLTSQSPPSSSPSPSPFISHLSPLTSHPSPSPFTLRRPDPNQGNRPVPDEGGAPRPARQGQVCVPCSAHDLQRQV